VCVTAAGNGGKGVPSEHREVDRSETGELASQHRNARAQQLADARTKREKLGRVPAAGHTAGAVKTKFSLLS
jgi:hypothetical protein